MNGDKASNQSNSGSPVGGLLKAGHIRDAEEGEWCPSCSKVKAHNVVRSGGIEYRTPCLACHIFSRRSWSAPVEQAPVAHRYLRPEDFNAGWEELVAQFGSRGRTQKQLTMQRDSYYGRAKNEANKGEFFRAVESMLDDERFPRPSRLVSACREQRS